MTEFNPELVRQLVQTVKIVSEDRITILFQSGIEIEQMLEGRKRYQGCGRPKAKRSAKQTEALRK
ncbi:hypothetical protein D3C74_171430 [compost metagenome]